MCQAEKDEERKAEALYKPRVRKTSQEAGKLSVDCGSQTVPPQVRITTGYFHKCEVREGEKLEHFEREGEERD